MVNIHFHEDSESAGSIRINFTPTPTFYVGLCGNNVLFNAPLPPGEEKDWVIIREVVEEEGTEDEGVEDVMLRFLCNGEEVGKFVISEENCETEDAKERYQWDKTWPREWRQVEFQEKDTATKYFKVGKIVPTLSNKVPG